MQNNPFLGRSLTTINDFTKDELMFLFQKTQRLKFLLNKENKTRRELKEIDSYRINDEKFVVKLMFIEDSTRTKNSFLEAMRFHKIPFDIFDAKRSSLSKGETYQDTVNTLVGQGAQMFILRTGLEGVCKHLQISSSKYVVRNKIGFTPMFINAGDGKHEHPTQTILDVFSYLEDNNWDTSFIHVAHLGDLLQGRTIHSQIGGLIKMFDRGMVDCIAPKELQIPEKYERLLEEAGFKVRKFYSIEEYIKLDWEEIARQWYFTRLQEERLPEHLKPMAKQLRSCVVFRHEFLRCLPKGTMFYHPLPRFNKDPVIPNFLDYTSINRWENQSRNGLLTRIIETAAFAGKIGHDFDGEIFRPPVYADNFITEEEPHPPKTENKYVMKPVKNGSMIDHILKGDDEDELGDYVNKIRKILGIRDWYGGVRHSKTKPRLPKGMLFLPDCHLTESQIKMLAAVSPGSSVNIIEQGKIIKKLRLNIPPRIYNLPGLSCINPDCIANYTHYEGTECSFIRYNNENSNLVCDYCGKKHSFKEIWR